MWGNKILSNLVFFIKKIGDLMPWCITCAELENPNWKQKGKISHKKISWFQYFQCKLNGHRCYI